MGRKKGEALRSHQYILRLTPEEYERIRDLADKTGQTAAGYIRAAVHRQMLADLREINGYKGED